MAARRGPLPRRSRAEWGVRGALALVAAVLGYVGVTHSLAENLRRADPARAFALAPGNAQVAGLLAQRRLTDAQGAAPPADVVPLARTALRHDPTVVPAVVTLGFERQRQGDVAGARRLLAYAQRLSRRDLQTQLWAIEDAVTRGDVPGTLQHYDIALRTSREAPDILFPVLSAAIVQPEVRAALVSTLRARPLWAAAFIGHVAGSETDPRVVAQLFTALRRAGLSISPDASAAVINRLVAGGEVDMAWQHYATLRRGADRRSARDPQFAATPGTPSVFDWIASTDATMTTALGAADGAGFGFALSPGSGGLLVQQLQWLPPGDYRLEGRSSGIEQPASSLPYWVLVCRHGGELGRVIVPAGDNGRFAGRFTVPSNCPVQTLALVGRASDAIGGVSGQIDHLALRPAR